MEENTISGNDTISVSGSDAITLPDTQDENVVNIEEPTQVTTVLSNNNIKTIQVGSENIDILTDYQYYALVKNGLNYIAIYSNEKMYRCGKNFTFDSQANVYISGKGNTTNIVNTIKASEKCEHGKYMYSNTFYVKTGNYIECENVQTEPVTDVSGGDTPIIDVSGGDIVSPASEDMQAVVQHMQNIETLVNTQIGVCNALLFILVFIWVETKGKAIVRRFVKWNN